MVQGGVTPLLLLRCTAVLLHHRPGGTRARPGLPSPRPGSYAGGGSVRWCCRGRTAPPPPRTYFVRSAGSPPGSSRTRRGRSEGPPNRTAASCGRSSRATAGRRASDSGSVCSLARRRRVRAGGHGTGAPSRGQALRATNKQINKQKPLVSVRSRSMEHNRRRLGGDRRRLGGDRWRLGGNRRRLRGNRRRLGGKPRRLGGDRRRLGGNRRRLGGN